MLIFRVNMVNIFVIGNILVEIFIFYYFWVFKSYSIRSFLVIIIFFIFNLGFCFRIYVVFFICV